MSGRTALLGLYLSVEISLTNGCPVCVPMVLCCAYLSCNLVLVLVLCWSDDKWSLITDLATDHSILPGPGAGQVMNRSQNYAGCIRC